MADHRVAEVTLDQAVIRWNPDVQREIDVAIFDLKEENSFAPQDVDAETTPQGPYALHLSILEQRLVMDVNEMVSGGPVCRVLLSTAPFRKIIRDYFAICESYYAAIKTSSPAQIEAIDMGRRGVHNEGSALLQERLDGKVAIDFDTARRLFTLLCALHLKA